MSSPADEEDQTASPEDQPYEGYQIVAEEDLLALQNQEFDGQRARTLPWHKSRSVKLKLITFLLLVSFILILIWQILAGNCRVSRLCNIVDLSSQQESRYKFHTFRFILPSSLLWIGLTSGSLLLLVSSALTIQLNKKTDLSPSSEYISHFIDQTSSIILLTQFLVIIVPSFILFLLIGILSSWTAAGTFSMGALTSTMTAHIVTSICRRRSVKSHIPQTIASSSESIKEVILPAIILTLTTIGLVTVATSATYLLHSDIQALTGFMAGSSLATFFQRTSSTLSFDSTITAFRFKPPFREVIPPNVVAAVASGVSLLTGFISDVYGSFAICTIATALLGSGLPFFENNPYALCIFNHLNIDQKCGPFGYPENISFATVLCRSRNLYLRYPSLAPENSVSRFVAVPFLLLVGTLSTYVLTSIFTVAYYKWMKAAKSKVANLNSVNSFKNILLISSVCCSALLIASSSAIFFGLFGTSSQFQNSNILGFGETVPREVLDGSATQCFVNATTLPSGVSSAEGYVPMFPSGQSYGSISSIPLRLFGCNCIGILAGLLIVLLTVPSYFRKKTLNQGGLAVVFRRFSVSILLQIPVIFIVMMALILPFKLYGSFGIGLAAIGYISSVGVLLTAKIIGILLINIESSTICIERRANNSNNLRKYAQDIYKYTTASWHIATNGAVTLSGFTGMFALVQKSGLWLSPRVLSGSVGFPSTNLMYYHTGVLLRNMFFVISLLIGALLPFLLASFFISASIRSSLAIYVVRKVRRHISISSAPSLMADVTKISFQECSFIFMLSIFTPMCIGFTFGQRALVSFVIGVIMISFILGLCFGGGNGISMKTSSSKIPTTTMQRNRNNNNSNADFLRPSKQNIAPCLQGALKVTISMSILTCTLMQEDERRWWVGTGLFAFVILTMAIIAWWCKRRFVDMMKTSSEKDDCNRWEAPERIVSPFYQGPNQLDPSLVNPRSWVGGTMRYFKSGPQQPNNNKGGNITSNMSKNGSVRMVELPGNEETDGLLLPRSNDNEREETEIDHEEV